MTRKHYIVIAKAMHDISTNEKSLELACRSLAIFFAADNERFDTVRFLKACGIE